MKHLIFTTSILLLIACQPHQHGEEQATSTTSEVDLNKYPEALQKVFAAHGGLDKWQAQHSMFYEIVREPQNEKHFIDLKDRRDRVEGANFKMGYDGSKVWLDADTSYKRDPKFYHNLMFYFYAMPFVVADDGIIYSETETISFEGKNYPGIKIGYNDGVGSSPKDEYLVHYDPETHQMAWLGYTATYFTQEKKETFNWIRYDDWASFNGLLLPNSISWYKVENGERTEPRNKVAFTGIEVSEDPFEDTIFSEGEATSP